MLDRALALLLPTTRAVLIERYIHESPHAEIAEHLFEAIVSRFVMPAESALIPQLVSAEWLVSANSLKSVSENVSRLVGAALGGILLGLFGLRSTLLLDIISFLFVAAMLWLIKMPTQTQVMPEPAPASIPEQSQSLLAAWKQLGREWLQGLRLIASQPPLLVLFVMFAVMNLGEGVFGVLLVVFVKQVLNAGASIYGSLLSVQTIGSLLGALFIGQLAKRTAPARLTWICCCTFGLIDLLIFNLPRFTHGVLPIAFLFILVGIPGVGMSVGMQTLLQTLVENRFLGRVSGAQIAVCSLMALIGVTIAGTLGDHLGPVLLLNIQGSVYFLSGILALLTLSGMLAKRTAARQKELAGTA